MSRFALLLGAVVLGTGCTTYMTLEPGAEQAGVTYEQGHPYITSTKGRSQVVVVPAQRQWKSRSEIGFYISAANLGDAPVMVDASNVSATAGGRELKVWTYEERMKKARRDAAWAGFGAAMAAASDGLNRQTTTTSGSAYSSSYGNNTNTTVNATSSTRGYSQAEIDARNKERTNAIRANRNVAIQDAEMILSTTTVSPGETVEGGLIVGSPKKAGLVELHIAVGPDVHYVTYNYAPVD